MTETSFTFTIDGVEIAGKPGQTIMEAADEAKIYIPRLCDVEGLRHQGSCRVCTVKADGRSVSACTEPAEPDMEVDNETPRLRRMRADLVGMLFHEGNHLCPICEASGKCELQAMAYWLGVNETSKFPRLEPCRPVDASHHDIALDTNRCISCGRCIRASQDVDGKGVFGYVGRGIHRRVAVNGADLADTNAEVTDHAMSDAVCPVGCIIRKREGFKTPIGEREFDSSMISFGVEGEPNE